MKSYSLEQSSAFYITTASPWSNYLSTTLPLVFFFFRHESDPKFPLQDVVREYPPGWGQERIRMQGDRETVFFCSIDFHDQGRNGGVLFVLR